MIVSSFPRFPLKKDWKDYIMVIQEKQYYNGKKCKNKKSVIRYNLFSHKSLKKRSKCYRIMVEKSYNKKTYHKTSKTFLNKVPNMTNYSKD